MWGRKKRIKYLESIWGKEIDRFRNFELVRHYHNYKIQNSKNEFVDNSTWADLNFNSIFSKIDRNISGIGQQFLFHIMHKYEPDENVLRNRVRLANVFRNNKKLREAIQLPLLNLTDVGVNFITDILFGDFPGRPKFQSLFYLLSLLVLLFIILAFFYPLFLFFAFGAGFVNLIVNKLYTDKINENFLGLSNLNKLIIVGIHIAKTDNEFNIQQIERIKGKAKLLKKLNMKLGKFVVDKSKINDAFLMLAEYANMLFLFDLIAYIKSVTILENHLDEIREVFESVAELDTIISLGSYIEEVGKLAIPKFTDSKTISFQDLYHPLLDAPVGNSINLIEKSVLITGSNMAGKTTFIKTVGVNIILSQTLFLCSAKSISTFRFVIKSSIKRDDNIEDSKSYFFSEIEIIKKFLDLAKGNSNYLFLIDEIFRGTNTIERLATSTGVLAFLNSSNRTFVTTHDIELQYLLGNSFDVFHFSEQVTEGKFFFDYKIARGNYSKGNAIKLLEIMEYPVKVTEMAKEVAKRLRESNPANEGLFKIG